MFDLLLFIVAMWTVRQMSTSKKPILLRLSDCSVGKREASLCRTCVCALIRKSGKGEELTSCTYGGRLNQVTFVVLECSG